MLQNFVARLGTPQGPDPEAGFAKLWRDFLVEFREDFRWLVEAEEAM